MGNVSEATFEISIGTLQLQNKRLFILCIILIAALIVSNGAWIVRETQTVDTVTETVETSSDGGDAYGTIISGDNGEVTYGYKSESNPNGYTDAQNP